VASPDVTKQSERAAEWNIRRRGLEVASTSEMQLPGTPADLVLAQSPPANASQVAAPRTSLLVTVAADPLAFVVPNFVGQPLGSASRTLQDAGFKLGTVSVAPAGSAAASSAPVSSPPVSAAPANGAPGVSTTPESSQPSAGSIIVTQWPPAGQKILAGAVLNFEVK
jgi:beta-lactam-binding protein with PASTA domain